MKPMAEIFRSKQARVDWVTFQREDDHDAMQFWADMWSSDLYDLGVEGWQGGYKVRIISATKGARRKWAMDVWGEMAHQWLMQHTAATVLECLTRIDFREEVKACELGLMELGQATAKHGAGGRNVTQYTSRSRKKQAKRDAGGIGYAIGSHKSRKRTSFYMRAGGAACVEQQLTDTAAKDAFDVFAALMRGGMGVSEAWEACAAGIVSNAKKDLAVYSGFEPDTFWKVAAEGQAAPERDVLTVAAELHDLLQGTEDPKETALLYFLDSYFASIEYGIGD